MTKEKDTTRSACISKQFGGVEVLSDINLDLCTGEIHALLEKMGQASLLLLKYLRVHRPTRGQMKLNGESVDVSSPIVAQN